MRPLLLSIALLSAACAQVESRPPPSDRFVYPSGVVHRSVPGSTNGVLYVSSSNFDRCFDQGTLMAVDLDRVGSEDNRLPALGSVTDPNAQPVSIEQLNIPSESRVYIQSYAGQMAFREGATPRLFVPARADGDFVHYIDVPEPTRLSCVRVASESNNTSDNCAEGALSLTDAAQVQGQRDDLPRASAPFGIALDPTGDLWVTHLNPVDSPIGAGDSLDDYKSYVVRLPGDTPSVSTENFFSLDIPDLPLGGSNSVVADERYVFVSGQIHAATEDVSTARRFLVRVLDKNIPGRIVDPGLDLSFAADDARGLALTERAVSTSIPQRLYVAVRRPDSLMIVNVAGIEAASDNPSLRVVGSVPLPDGPTEVRLVPRENRGELVLVSCSDAGVVAIYDPDVGQIVAQVPVGETQGTQSPQPFGLAVQTQGNAARIFASNFGDGRVSVIDIPDLGSPQLARLVAHLGARQDRQDSSTCQEAQQ